jgi:NitT/TauT family transport system ATP-binding protein
MTAAKIQIRQVSKVFKGQGCVVQALEDINLDIRPNEFITFVGASGCGKSTLLRSIGGLEQHSSGEILLGGRAVNGPGIDRAMVFQHYSLYPWLTVMQNIKFCRQLKVVSDTVRNDADIEVASGCADALLNLMGLSAFANAYPNQLSGGMQQRVAIARALMPKPEIMRPYPPGTPAGDQHQPVRHPRCGRGDLSGRAGGVDGAATGAHRHHLRGAAAGATASGHEAGARVFGLEARDPDADSRDIGDEHRPGVA